MLRTAIAVCLVAVLVACGQTDTAEPTPILQRGLSAEPETLDPQLARSVPALTVLADLYEGLLTRDAAGRLVPGVADRWSVSEDGLTLSFELDPVARWSNGSRVVADDFVRAWRYLADPARGAFYAQLLSPLAGFDAVYSGDSDPDALAVVAETPERLVVRLRTPQPDFFERLSLPALAPRADQEALSNGAYRVAERQLGRFELAANPYHPDAESVQISQVTYQVFEQEQTELAQFDSAALDVSSRVPRSLFRAPEAYAGTLRRAPYLGVVYLSFNLRAALPEPLREALSLTVDRQILVDKVLARGEQPAWTLVPPGTVIGDVPYSPYEPAVARESLATRQERARLLVPDASQMPPVVINYASNEENRSVALALQQMWQQALPGLEVQLNNQEFRVVLSRARSGEFDGLVRGSWIADYNDPQQFVELLRSDATTNSSGMNDPQYDALLDAASVESDPQARARLLRQAEIRLHAQHAVIPLYVMVSKHLVSERVRGWQDNPLDLHLSRYLSLEQL